MHVKVSVTFVASGLITGRRDGVGRAIGAEADEVSDTACSFYHV